jgi:Uma2 family endonuclease
MAICHRLGILLNESIARSFYTYPDISIICGKPATIEYQFDTVSNPTVIIEILSKSTQSYDMGQKFTLYRDIDTLQEYILIDSTSVRVEKYKRNDDNSWLLREYKTIDDVYTIDSIGIELLLSEIYVDVWS